MTADEIKQRLQALQDEINQLVDRLPEEAYISFGTVFHTQPTNVTRHKHLALSIRTPEPE